MPRIFTVNFEGVESGSKFIRVPEGDYLLKMVSCKGKKGEESGKSYLSAVFEITGGDNKKGKGKKINHSFSLQKQSLWNLRNWLEATGKSVPQKALKIDMDKLIGLECAGTIIDDQPYEGKIKSIISAFFPTADLGNTSEDGAELEEEATEETEEEESLEEEKPKKSAKKPAKKAAKKAAEEEEEEAEESSDEEEDLFS